MTANISIPFNPKSVSVALVGFGAIIIVAVIIGYTFGYRDIIFSVLFGLVGIGLIIGGVVKSDRDKKRSAIWDFKD